LLKKRAISNGSPQKVIGQLKAYFGNEGLGLQLVSDTDCRMIFIGTVGYVMTTLHTADKQTSVIIETHEWEYFVHRFLEHLE
jgi:hypothetical protein